MKRIELIKRTGMLGMAMSLALHMTAQNPHPLTTAQVSRINSIIAKMTLDQKIEYIGGTGYAVRAMPQLHLPSLLMSDGPMGVRSNEGLPSTAYASQVGLAASWDRSLSAVVGASIGRDARARGVYFMLGPGVNIYRSPLDSRNFEFMGEDPYLAGQMASSYIVGMQSQGVSATIKHYLANNSEFSRFTVDSVISERALREIYLPAFEMAVKLGHVGAVMNSYNLINGEYATQNAFFNIQVLRREWGFQGTLMSDWNATHDGVAAANNGLDIEMPTGKFMNKETLLPAIQSGKISEALIDEKVRHILSTAMMFDWLDRDQVDRSIPLQDPADNAVALRSARESITLLKNQDHLLPLRQAAVKTILVVGQNAMRGIPVGGGSASVKPVHTISLLEGLEAVAPHVKVEYEAGIPSLNAMAETTNFMTAPSGGQKGVLVERFHNKGLRGTPETSKEPHMHLPLVTEKMLDSGVEDPDQNKVHIIAQRATGYYDASSAGEYLLTMEGPAERLYLDGKLTFDDWDWRRAAEPHQTVHLSAGMHKLVVESWQGSERGGGVAVGLVPESSLVSARTRELAAKADVVIIAAGFQGNENEHENSDRTFDLPAGQDALILAMEAANRRTILSVTSGGNVDSERWIEKTPAWIEQWYGGQAEGLALAEALFGDIDPAGHLPVTFERRAQDNPTYDNYYPQNGMQVNYREGLFVGYRGYEKNDVKPLFPFGYGLSYTTFRFSNIKIRRSDGVGETVEFNVTNTGQREGADVAQVYVGEDHPTVTRPKHELKGFERVELKPGETKRVSITLDARSFAYWNDAEHAWKIDAWSVHNFSWGFRGITATDGEVDTSSKCSNHGTFLGHN